MGRDPGRALFAARRGLCASRLEKGRPRRDRRHPAGRPRDPDVPARFRTARGRTVTLREQLARDEGLKLTAYQDALGVWTLGYGHNLANPIPRAAAALILEADLDDALQQVRDRLSWSIDVPEARRAVLVNMAFNLGMAGL